MEISVSYLNSLYSKEKTILNIEKTTANYLHVDLMDGGFVPQRNFELADVLKLLKNHELPLDIHLMVFDPLIYIDKLAELEPSYITFHLEATKDIVKTIEAIKRHNIKVGLSIKPDTNIMELMPYLSIVDLVLVMSVEPGAGGQSFIPASSNRLEILKNYRESNNLTYKIEVDGGINDETLPSIKNNLDIAVVGSYICLSKNYQERINKLKETLNIID